MSFQLQGVYDQVEKALQEVGNKGLTEAELVTRLYPGNLDLDRICKTDHYLRHHTGDVRYVLWLMIHEGKFQPSEGKKFVLTKGA